MAALAARGVLDAQGRSVAPPPGTPMVRLLDGSRRVGLKILVSGGGRCNVTNERVSELDYDSDTPHEVRHLLRGFSAASVRHWFEAQGCPLYAEPLGKLFPRSDRARDVLGVLLDGVARAGAVIETGAEVVALRSVSSGFEAGLADGRTFVARRVIVATGGRSMPGTGSRGFGFELAAQLGHRLITPLPALTPLFLAPDGPLASLAGVTVPALLSLVPRGATPEQVEGRRFRPLARSAGSLLITHRGISGPVALDVSGACARALADGAEVVLSGDFFSLCVEESPYAPYLRLDKPPGASLPPDQTPRPSGVEAFRRFIDLEIAEHPRRALAATLARWLPRSLAEVLLHAAGLDLTREARTLGDADWRRVHRAVVHADLRLIGTDGYQKAEVTCGGVPLAELQRGTLESRRVPGLHFCGEVVNCTGRLGGFNFQWAWSSGYAAGCAARASIASADAAEPACP